MLPSRLAGGAPGGQHGKGGHVLSKVRTKGAMFNSIDRRLLLLLGLFPSSVVAGMVLNIILPLCPVFIHPPPLHSTVSTGHISDYMAFAGHPVLRLL